MAHGSRIALVGRPNVGKSTLFNRLIGTRKAVVSPLRGTTRDYLSGPVEWGGTSLTLVDTGGFDFASREGLAGAIQRHIRRALEECQGVVLVCDASEGLLPADAMIMEHLRKIGKPVILAVNKTDHRLVVPPDFFSLGVATAVPISALHGRGTGELLDRLVEQFPPSVSEPQVKAAYSLAIVGRQNVGKSSLLNALLREERVLVDERPGTTRDAVDTSLFVEGERVVLIDTAGLRRRSKVSSPVDLFAMSRSIQAIQHCDAALVVLDAVQGITRDDQRIVAQVCEAGCGLLLLMNKWDLVKERSERALTIAVHQRMAFAAFAPVLAVSAKTGFHVMQSLLIARRIVSAMRKGLAPEELLSLLQRAWAARPVPRVRGRAVRLREGYWRPGRPVRIELATSPGGRLPIPYQRYLLKTLHAYPTLSGIPLQLTLTLPEGRPK